MSGNEYGFGSNYGGQMSGGVNYDSPAKPETVKPQETNFPPATGLLDLGAGSSPEPS